MTTQNRQTLKGYFSVGARPTARNFEDLIDSTLIMNDEGFIKTLKDGLRIISLGSSQALMSFEGPTSIRPAWSLGFGGKDNGKEHNVLALRRGPQDAASGPPALSFWDLPATPRDGADAPTTWRGADPLPYVGVGTDAPTSKLDVRGVIRSEGRAGTLVDVPADGQPHIISGPTDLRGCVALEVVAGVGIPDTGRFAIVHALAMNAYHPSRWDNWFGNRVWPLLAGKTPIRHTHAYYSRRADRLQLSWTRGPLASKDQEHGKGARYTLCIRSRSPYLVNDGKQFANVRTLVTKLWFDPHMNWAESEIVPPDHPVPKASG
jgi:hypothetical protein